jgi:hypothetical protein
MERNQFGDACSYFSSWRLKTAATPYHVLQLVFATSNGSSCKAALQGFKCKELCNFHRIGQSYDCTGWARNGFQRSRGMP